MYSDSNIELNVARWTLKRKKKKKKNGRVKFFFPFVPVRFAREFERFRENKNARIRQTFNYPGLTRSVLRLGSLELRDTGL